MTIRETIIDTYSALSHKLPMRQDVNSRAVSAVTGWVPGNWTGEENRRRLTAYMILSAYDQNVSREFLSTTDEADRDERREYGDAALVIDQTLAALLGDSQEIVVDGAADYDRTLDDPPAEGDDDRDPADVAANDAARVLSERQAFLREWADDVHLPLRIVESDRNGVKLGDGVILLGWDADKGRPIPSVMDPGFYFPVIPDSLDAYDFPRRVHFAWEIPGDEFTDGKVRVRRITYELVRLRPIIDYDAAQRSYATPEAFDEAVYSLPVGTRWVNRPIPGLPGETMPVLVRKYPWADEESEWVCHMTDATWVLDDLNDARKPDAFTVDAAETERARDLDLGIDFLPVVHVPNTPAGHEHFGQSSLARVLQLLDDIQNADTDAQAASATTGSPIVGVSGSTTKGDDPLTGTRGKPLEVRPGEVWKLGDAGRMDVLDTSAGLQATREYVLHLLDRLSTNARLPAAVLGRLKPSEVPSGFAMQLSFGPLTSMVRQMRLVRSVKYPLMLKMVQRLYQANGVLPPGPTPRAELKLGAYLPSDMQGVLTSVRDAYGANLISLETAVTMLLEVGFTIDDVAEEIQRIQSRDFEGANRLADATGDTGAVLDYLGRDVPETPTPAPVIIPPASGGAGAGG